MTEVITALVTDNIFRLHSGVFLRILNPVSTIQLDPILVF